jgi:hypothetical protein
VLLQHLNTKIFALCANNHLPLPLLYYNTILIVFGAWWLSL